jgi:signal transduction histidine kinase
MPLALFVGIMVLALAQALWWLIYQVGEGGRQRELQLRIYEERAAVALRDLALFDRPLSEAEHQLFHHRYPGLALMASEALPVGVEPVVSGAVIDRIWSESRRRSRMFLAEGCFFTTLILFGVWLQLVAHRRQEAALQQQSNFVAAVTHELKSPLTSIRLYAELLEGATVADETRRRAAAAILEDAGRLGALVEQILRARTLELRDARLEREELELGAWLAGWLEKARERAAQRSFVLLSQGPAEPLPVLADREALGTIAGNLLDNALKYAAGTGELRIELNRVGRFAELVVADRGPGFDPDESRRLFDRFYRAGDENTRRAPGTGLGLYIVRELAQAMGGRVRAESEGAGRGARFSVLLPLLQDNARNRRWPVS